MTMAHKEDERVFRFGELRFVSAFKVVDDETGGILGTTIATMDEGNPDSWHAYLTGDGGATFHPAGWHFREFPFPPTLVQSVDDTTVETNATRVADLRRALEKWHELINAG
jgi:hypothetical protein